MDEELSDEECMKERKWWCFLLSSIFTFLAGLFIILLWRAFAFLFNSKESGDYSHSELKMQKNAGKEVKSGEATTPSNAAKMPDQEIGYMTEAKDWAGELISGQSTTGRILVSTFFFTLVSNWAH